MKKVKEVIPSGSGKRQLVIMFTTLTALGAGFAYYFFGYVKVKEDSLNEMGFRVLSRLGTNIVSKKENVIKNAKNIMRKELNDLADNGGNRKFNANQVNSNSQNKDVHFIEAQEIASINYPLVQGTADLLIICDSIKVALVPAAFRIFSMINRKKVRAGYGFDDD